MKKLIPFFTVLLLLTGCSESDSNEMEIEKEPSVSLPTLTTTAISDITQTSAVSGGNISNNGGADITARGVCWSTSSKPTITDSKTSDSSGQGEFSSLITNLEAGSDYFLRSYATNSKGTSYGNEVSFKTSELTLEPKVFQGDVILTSQQEVDEFGAQNYTEINGSLTIQDQNTPSTIKDLGSLNTLFFIRGTLSIIENFALEIFQGFPNLIEVGENLIISGNTMLSSIDAFKKVVTIKGNLSLINESDNMELMGFDGLERIEGAFSIRSSNTNEISEINGFSQLEIVDRNFVLSGVSGKIEAFRNLTNVNGVLALEQLSEIKNFDFFVALQKIKGEFRIAFNSSLESFGGLNDLTRLGGLNVVGNNSLISVDGLNNIAQIDGDVIISANDVLNNVNGLQNLVLTAGGRLDINQNGELRSLSGLSKLVRIDRGLKIWGNPELVNLDGLQSLDRINGRIGYRDGGILIGSNAKLESLDGLENLTTSLGGDIQIINNSSLKNLNGLKNLTTVRRNSAESRIVVTIYGNHSLDSFCGLKTLFESNSSSEVIFDILDNATPDTVLSSELEKCD